MTIISKTARFDNARALTHEEMFKIAPSIFAIDKHESRSAKFKPIFGSRAALALQAKFKIVKNSNIVISDNDIKASVITAINTYFNLNNWDFGETFYFSELSEIGRAHV